MNPNACLFKKYMAQTSDLPYFTIEVDHAEGVYIWDKQGKRYWDFLSGMSVNHLGHRHPLLTAAAKAQMEKYLHVMAYGEFIQEPQVLLAERLAQLLPANLQMTFFVNTGSEAMDGALKLARLYNHREEIISFENSYHGSTFGALSLVGKEEFKAPFHPVLPTTKLFPYNDLQVVDQITEKTCCVVVEPIQSGGGMKVPDQAFLSALRKKCTETGTLLIFDEIQSGFGRTGKLFAFEHFNISPDILCVAKSMGGGFPLGAFISSPEIMKSLNNGHPLLGHASTFGGHPVACACALALLEVVAEKEFLASVAYKGELMKQQLLQNNQIKEVTGKGLFMAAHLKHPENIEKMVQHCMQNGLLTFWLLFNKTAMEFCPPLIITEEEIKEAIAVIHS